ncbi:MAG: 4Fe-4S dicluster domain-containing protein [Desulfarculus sp.]|nr:4Fe-4S dicluster domain-containing protein [Desulfarculus sp.]
MAFNRRDFLKIAGLSAAVGLGGKTAWELLLPGQLDAAEMPAASGLTAKRWGMALDVKKFTPAVRQACIAVCNQSHNVPKIDSKQGLKWIWEAGYEAAFPDLEAEYVEDEIKEMPFLVMCNHCDNPPCVRVCPTKATFKRGDGIVMMDMHRCIGCRFCMAACPYGSRSFNFHDPRKFLPDPAPNKDYPTRTKGVVEKCTFCTERLAVGKLPYCVEASQGAMLFGDMSDAGSAPRKALRTRYAIRRNAGLGTNPQVYYLI